MTLLVSVKNNLAHHFRAIPEAVPWILPLLIPATVLSEFLFFRLWLKYGLKIRIGYSYMTDFDVVCPGILATVLFFAVLHASRSMAPHWGNGYWKTHALLVGILILFSLCFRVPEWGGSVSFVRLWLTTAFLVLLSGFFAWIPAQYFWHHPKRLLVFPALAIACSKILSRHAMEFLWDPIAAVTGKLVYFFLQPLVPGLHHLVHWAGKDPYTQVGTADFTIAIGSGCSGIEGMSFFAATLLFTYLLDSNRFRWHQWLLWFWVGMFYFFVLNFARIASCYLIGLWLIRHVGHAAGVQFALSTFHNLAGWAFHVLGLVTFFYAMALLERDRLWLISFWVSKRQKA